MFHINCILLMIAGQVARTKSNNVTIINPANSNNTIAIGFPDFTVACYFVFQPFVKCYWQRKVVYRESILYGKEIKKYFKTFGKNGTCNGTLYFSKSNLEVFCREFVNEKGNRSFYTELKETATPKHKALGFYAISCFGVQDEVLRTRTDYLKVIFLSKYVIFFISQNL